MIVRQHASRLTRRAAFTLMEMMVVVAIIVVLGGIAVVAYTSFSDRGNEARISADLRAIDTAIGEYYLEYNDWPQQLQQLSTPNAFGKVLLEPKYLNDPWGNPYGYDPTGQKSTAAGSPGKPDIWCDHQNFIIGNFTNYKKMPK
ncbi:MAG: type II secretion system protein GspG [Gemmataceae bacterium]